MKLLVVSDIHANIEAFDAVLEAEKGLYDGLLFLGDVTGYGPDPEPCIARLRSLAKSVAPFYCLSGNHDAALFGKIPLEWFNSSARRSVEFTRGTLSAGSLEWLSTLSPSLELPDLVCASHASPLDPLTEYILGGIETSSALKFLESKKMRLCFTGHTHMVAVYSASFFTPARFPVSGQTIKCRGTPMILNPGSVGFPRKFNGGRTADMPGKAEPICAERFPAYYAVWDTKKMEIGFCDVRYDRRPVEEKIAGLKL